MGRHSDDHKPKQKRRRHCDEEEDDKKHKKPIKEHKRKHKSERRDSKRRQHDDEVDLDDAMVVLKELLNQFPALMSELIGLLQALDDGETVAIGGIENREIRSRFKKLFPLLGLREVDRKRHAFVKKSKDSLLQLLQQLLSPKEEQEQEQEQQANNDIVHATLLRSTSPRDQQEEEESNKREQELVAPPEQPDAIGPQLPAARTSGPIGPALPSSYPAAAAIIAAQQQHHVEQEEEDDDDDVVGPALPGMKGFRQADAEIEAEMARQEEQLRQEEWRRVRGETQSGTDNKSAPLRREEWMTTAPENFVVKDHLMNPPTRGNAGKPAQFRSKEPQAIDPTWFDAPEDRDRAKRAKLDMELLGYVRPENLPKRGAVASSVQTPKSDAVNQSIMPAPNEQADDNMRHQMEELRQSRGPSLMEKHQQKLAKQDATGKAAAAASRGWNRERDIETRREMSRDQAQKIVEASKQIGSKFTAPTLTRQFL